MSTRETVWIVDYDLPINSSRRQFYREIKRLMRELNLTGNLSTLSVVTVEDEELARRIFDLASKYGRAHLYRAERIA
jgi:hypothetical protein